MTKRVLNKWHASSKKHHLKITLRACLSLLFLRSQGRDWTTPSGTRKRSTPASTLNGIHPWGEKLNTHAQRYTHKDVYHREVLSCENRDSVLQWMLPGSSLSVTNSSQRPSQQRTALMVMLRSIFISLERPGAWTNDSLLHYHVPACGQRSVYLALDGHLTCF